MALIFKGTGQVKRGLAADWTSANPTLASGEWGYEEDTGNVKIGDGTTAWISLPYFTGVSAVDSVNGYTGVVVLGTDDISEGATNKYNATHTGQVIGDEALTLRSEAITDQGLKGSITGGEFMLLEDGGTLYKQEITNIAPVRSVNGGVGAVTTPHYANTNLTATGNRSHDFAAFSLQETFASGSNSASRGIANNLAVDVIQDATDISTIHRTKNQINQSVATPAGSNAINIKADKIQLTMHATAPLELNGAVGSAGQALISQGAGAAPIWRGVKQVIALACSDETTALTTGTAKATFRMPYAMTLTGVRCSVTTAPTGSVLTVDINEGGVSILSTKLTIDATEKTSVTAATPAVISDSSLADDSEITIDIDTVGSTVAGAGLKVYLIGYES